MLHRTMDQEFERQGQEGLIILYDVGGTLASLVEKAVPENVRLLRYEGSYLAVRLALEGEDPEFQKRWLLYVPDRPPEESWLRDWELLGTRWEMDLLELLHRESKLTITKRLTELLRDRPQNARDLVCAWGTLVGEQTVTERRILDDLLALSFELSQWQINEGLMAFLNGNLGRRELEARGLWGVWRETVAEWTGWQVAPEEERAFLRKLKATILLSELVDAIPELTARLTEVLPSESRRSSVVALAADWRSRESSRDSYLQASRMVEREYELSNILTVSEALLAVETFAVIEELWRHEVMNAVAPDCSNLGEKVRRVKSIAEQRSKLFWATHGKAPFWETMAIAARLYEDVQGVVKESQKLTRLEDFVTSYVAEDGWWRLDLLALELARGIDTLTEEERNRFARPAWRAYGDYLNRANVHFAEAVERDGWRPETTQFFTKFLASHDRTAVLLVDGMRFDLAKRLGSVLQIQEFQVTPHVLRGMLPSVTEIGMAALLPGAERGLEVKVDAGRLQVRLGGEEVWSRQGRSAWLERELGRRVRVIELDNLERSDLEGADLLIVLSQEVDQLGTFVADIYPGGLLDMIDRIARSICKLREKGFERFLVTADHGFLFLPPGVQPFQVDAPDAKVCKRRFAVGWSGEGCVAKGGKELGLQSSELFAFPMGLAVFALKGEVSPFLHGGVSLQESLIPVLETAAVPMAKKVLVVMEFPPQLTSRIVFVTVRLKELTLFAQQRRVLVEIDGKRSEIAELNSQQQKVTLRIPWLGFDEPVPARATIRLFDADSLQVLQEHVTPVELVV
jgi:hypothetical protein